MTVTLQDKGGNELEKEGKLERKEARLLDFSVRLNLCLVAKVKRTEGEDKARTMSFGLTAFLTIEQR